MKECSSLYFSIKIVLTHIVLDTLRLIGKAFKKLKVIFLQRSNVQISYPSLLHIFWNWYILGLIGEKVYDNSITPQALLVFVLTFCLSVTSCVCNVLQILCGTCRAPREINIFKHFFKPFLILFLIFYVFKEDEVFPKI